MFTLAYERTTLSIARNLGKISIIAFLALFSWGLYAFVQWNNDWHAGIWAGMHRSSAIFHAKQVMVTIRGVRFASTMHLADPPAVRSHSDNLLQAGQVWNVHLIGKHGTKWCVKVWHPTYNWAPQHIVNIGSEYSVNEGCVW